MSSAQVIDSEKAEKQLQRFFADNSRQKADGAFKDADSKRAHAAEAMDGRFSTNDASAQMGRAMGHQEIQKRLLTLNLALIFERSHNYPDKIGIYIWDGTSNMTDLDPLCRGRRHLAGMMFGMNPEFTIRKTEKTPGGVEFRSEVRGWRTVLRRLIGAGIISLSAAERIFEIHKGRDSEAWFRSLE